MWLFSLCHQLILSYLYFITLFVLYHYHMTDTILVPDDHDFVAGWWRCVHLEQGVRPRPRALRHSQGGIHSTLRDSSTSFRQTYCEYSISFDVMLVHKCTFVTNYFGLAQSVKHWLLIRESVVWAPWKWQTYFIMIDIRLRTKYSV